MGIFFRKITYFSSFKFEVENEYHFVCVCPIYSDIRITLYNKVIDNNNQFVNFNDKDKFIYLMKSQWKLLGTYLEKAWQKRHVTLYT